MLEIYSRWWCLNPEDYLIYFKKGTLEEIYTIYHFMDTFSKALFDDADLIPFAKVLSKMPVVDGSRPGKKKFQTWDAQKYLDEQEQVDRKVSHFGDHITVSDLCTAVVFVFTEFDIHEEIGLGDPRIIFIQQYKKMYKEVAK